MYSTETEQLIPVEILLTKYEFENLLWVSTMLDIHVSETIRNSVEFFDPNFDFEEFKEFKELMEHAAKAIKVDAKSFPKTLL